MRSNIWKLCVVNFFSSMFFFSAALIPFFTEWGGISFQEITFLQFWFVLWVFILEIPTGAIADRWGRKWSILLGECTWFVGVIVYASTPNIGIFLLGEFLLAFAVSLISGANQALLYDTLKALGSDSNSRKILARFKSVSYFGHLIGALIGSFIVAQFGPRYTMSFMTFPTIVAIIMAISIVEPPMEVKTKKNYWRTLFSGLRYFARNNAMHALVADYALIGSVAGMSVWLYQIILTEYNIPIHVFGLIHAAIMMLEILILNSFVLWERISGTRRRFLLVSALIAASAYILLGIHVLPTWMVILCIILIPGVSFPRMLYLENYMHKHIDSGARATALSTANMIWRGSWGVGCLALGVLVKWSLWGSLIILGFIIIILAITSRIAEEHLIDHQPKSEEGRDE